MKNNKLIKIVSLIMSIIILLSAIILIISSYQMKQAQTIQMPPIKINPALIEPPSLKEIQENYVTVKFETKPSKANLYINNKPCGLTPLDIQLNKKEKVEITFKKEGYESHTIYSFEPNENKKNVSVDLQKIVYHAPIKIPYIPQIIQKPAPKPKPKPQTAPTTF